MSSSVDFENLIERFPILNVSPQFEGGKYPAKLIQNEIFPVHATVFREGHDKVGANCLLKSPSGKEVRFLMFEENAGKNEWGCLAKIGNEIGKWTLQIESWADDYHTWANIAKIKVEANVDIELVFLSGVKLFTRWLEEDSLSTAAKTRFKNIINTLKDHKLTPDKRLSSSIALDVEKIWQLIPLRSLISTSKPLPIQVDRELASFSAWYQFFPRSEGAKLNKDGTIKSGTLRSAARRLQMVKDMGFDIIYLPPIHPIGQSFRKGKNNSLVAKANDPGSPWAVGGVNADGTFGGHEAIHSDLGTEADFKYFVKTAKSVGLEVSLDIALQCSPDHPWVKEHSEWFKVRDDGTIAYAENPPKKYQDIYPLNFDNDPNGLATEILKMLKKWIEMGVSVLRIDNPHTKPVWLWQWLIKEIKKDHPEVVWLAEAFTLPAMMKTLGLVGFDQSHSYFLWRNSKQELVEFLTQISGDDAFWQRSTLWPTTPDNLTDFLANGGEAAHAIRAVLAAMGSPTWGIYSGYEFVEDCQRKNPDGTVAAEHANSEKYEIAIRDWSKVDKVSGIKQLITKLNLIRKSHESCRNFHSMQVQTTNNDEIIAFARHVPAWMSENGKDDTVIVIVNLNPKSANQATVWFDWGALNLPERFKVVDELTGKDFIFSREQYVDLSPVVDVAHVLKVVRD